MPRWLAVSDVVAVLGLALLATGLWLVYAPLSLMVTGALLLAGVVVRELRRERPA